MKKDKPKNYKKSGVLFLVAGLLWNISAIISDNTAVYVCIGCMNICIGLSHISKADKEKRKTKKSEPAD